jgi:D-alanyl-lipoteichoic acid acyltransferase DltB (MBOAT superfamily)
MLFNSLQFLIFFPIVTLGYFLLPHRLRWVWLLLASCLFYMAFIPIYIFILLITILIDYFAGILIEKSVGKKKKIYLIISIISTCAVLFIFKYFNFFNSNFSAFAGFLHLNYPIGIINIILPIGLSFHTFQSLSYVIEVYRGKQKAEHHFGIYSLYVMFYPQLVAGPIERPQNLLHQFREKHVFDYQRVTDGLKLMAWGLFKKVVIADRLAILVNQVYGSPQNYEGLALIIATVFFAFQIYCDFSGYSDIAIGSAQVMGFKLMDNFNRPYFSKSISEFWKRWHISLSTWFRDYVYISLGGNRVVKWRWYFNLFITFVISGLWHGANWTFVIWGTLHGFYLIFSIWTSGIRSYLTDIVGIKKFPRFQKIFKVFITFLLVCFAWIFFRAKNLGDAWYIVTHLFVGFQNIPIFISQMSSLTEIVSGGKIGFLICILSIIFMELIHLLQRHNKIRHMLSERPFYIRWLIYYLLVLGILLFGVFGNNNFIYFQF